MLQILTITIFCAIFCSIPQFRRPQWRNLRAFLFLSVGFYGCLPMAHIVEQYGRSKADEMIGWNLMFLEGMSYFAGALIYAASRTHLSTS